MPVTMNPPDVSLDKETSDMLAKDPGRYKWEYLQTDMGSVYPVLTDTWKDCNGKDRPRNPTGTATSDLDNILDDAEKKKNFVKKQDPASGAQYNEVATHKTMKIVQK